eukprot:23066-Rhodomonas_salina.1
MVEPYRASRRGTHTRVRVHVRVQPQRVVAGADRASLPRPREGPRCPQRHREVALGLPERRQQRGFSVGLGGAGGRAVEEGGKDGRRE